MCLPVAAMKASTAQVSLLHSSNRLVMATVICSAAFLVHLLLAAATTAMALAAAGLVRHVCLNLAPAVLPVHLAAAALPVALLLHLRHHHRLLLLQEAAVVAVAATNAFHFQQRITKPSSSNSIE